MIIYTVDVFEKHTENLVLEVNIPERDLPSVTKIMKWNEEDKMDFLRGVAVFNVSKEQAELLGGLLGETFDTDLYIIQMSAGEI